MDILNKKIVIATHYLVYGAPQALREYLIDNKFKKLIFIAHPLKIDETKSYIEYINDGNVKERRQSKIRFRVAILNYFFEMYLTLRWVFMAKDKFDIFFGVDNLNALTGIFLKKLGKTKKVIFYTIDYVPQRFNNKILNNIYHWLDKFCLKNADEVWNVSPRIAEGREEIRGLKKEKYNNQKVVPIGIWFNKIERKSFSQIKKQQLLFIGNLLEKQGVQIVLDAIPIIIKKIPNFHFLIVGGGEYEKKLEQKTRELKIKNHVTFTGWVKGRKELDKVITDSALAVAMYNREKDNFTYYADPTKLKDYLSVGLPILLTDVPYNAEEIEKNKCGVIIKYNKESVAEAVIDLMEDENKLKWYRQNAINYVKQFDWNVVFRNSLKDLL